MRKLDSLSKDVLSFLKKNEPKMVLWREIKNALYPNYKNHYKNEHSFNVALTDKLTQLKAKELIKKEGDYYGTLKSFIKTETKESHPSKFGSWEWLKHRSEKKRLEESRVFKPKALPLVENLYEKYGYDFLKPYIEHDKQINKKVIEFEKKN